MPGTAATWGAISCSSTLRKSARISRVRHAARDGLDGQHLAGIGDHLMAGIEDADLHRLIGVDIVGEGGADAVPIGAPGAERVLDHPLAEVLVGDGGGVVDTEARQPAPVPSGRWQARCNRPWNSGRWQLAVDPVGKIRVRQAREAKHGLAQDIAVALQVVAALAGEGAVAGRAAQPSVRRSSRRTPSCGASGWAASCWISGWAACERAIGAAPGNSRPRSPSAPRCGSSGRPSARSGRRCHPRRAQSRSSSR